MAAPPKRSFEDYSKDLPGPIPQSRNIAGPNGLNKDLNGVETNRTPTDTKLGFEPTATIVLIGIRGTGKSSLAFLAASAYSRRVIEYEREFSERTGQTLVAHRQSEKTKLGRKKRQEVLLRTLNEHDHNAVVVCDFSDLEYGSNILLAYAARHPVIFVDRDVQGISDYLQWDIGRVRHLALSSASLLRQCSNYEFFNWTDTDPEGHSAANVSFYINSSEAASNQAPDEPTSFPFLRLKRAERDFLKFLRLILGDTSRSPSQQSAYPLSDLPLHLRRFTYAASITVDEVVNNKYNLEQFQIGSDALRLRITDLTSSKDERQAAVVKIAKAFSMLRRSTILPLILDPDLPESGRSQYADVWKACRRLAPEYLTVDLTQTDLRRFAVTKGNSRLIGVSHVDDWNSKEGEERCGWAESLGCRMLLLTSPSQSHDTLATSLQLFRSQSIKRIDDAQKALTLSTYNTGLAGRFSQYSNPGLGLVRGDGADLTETAMGANDGCCSLTAQSATKALFASYIYIPLSFCIVGGNVDYSLSPALHNAAYQVLGMPHGFTTKSTNTLKVLDQLKSNPNFGGAAFTQPYKIAVVERLDSLSEHAKVIRAVNTVLPIRSPLDPARSIAEVDLLNSRNRSGPVIALHGDNTDWIGMRACLRRGLSPINAVRKTSTGLVIGAGGMARAGVYAMLHMGVKQIFICNRTRSRAEELAGYYNAWLASSEDENGGDGKATVHVLPSLDSEWPRGYRLPTMIISSVPAEEVGGRLEAKFTLPAELLASPSGGVVVELTYKPLVTALVRQVCEHASRGWIVMTGLDMLPEQAFAQFELFTGRRAPRHIMRAEVLKDYQRQRETA